MSNELSGSGLGWMKGQDAVLEWFSSPKRQHFLSVVRFFVKNGWAFVRSFWPAVAGLAFNESFRMYAGAVSVGIFVLLCVAAVIEHWKFTFHVEGASLVVHRGLIERERIVIPFHRIQAVHLEQSWWQRILQLHGVRVDTAGTSGAEVEISALRSDQAQALKRILSSARLAEQEQGESPELLALDWRKLLKIGLTQNHLRNAAISFGAVLAAFEPFGEVLEGMLEAVSPAWQWVAKVLWVLLIPLGMLFFGIVGVAVSLLGALIRYYRFRLVISEEALGMTGGWLKTFEYKIPLQKIQVLERRSNVLQRLAGFESFRIHQARSQSDAAGSGVQLTIPGLEGDQAKALDSVLFELDPSVGPLRTFQPHAIFWWKRLAMRLILLTPLLFFGGFWPMALWVAWAVWSAVYVWECRRRFRFGVTHHTCTLDEGWLRRRGRRAAFYKMQRVSIRATWLMRRRGLAHVVLYTAAGPMTVPYLPLNEAKRVRDWLLRCVESHAGDWM